MEAREYDLAIIGGGIVGCSLFSEAVLKGVKAVLLEADNDVSVLATKANSGIIHSGYDPMPDSKMARFNVRGNQIYPALCKRLNVDFMACGSLTVAPKEGREKLQMLLERGKKNGVPNLRIVEKAELFAMEPNLADGIEVGLFAPSAGVVSPFNVCIALAEEGVINGGTLLTNFAVDKIEKIKSESGESKIQSEDKKIQSGDNKIQAEINKSGGNKNQDKYIIQSGDKQVVAKYVVNCAGANANEVNALVGIKPYPMNFVKGEYILSDKTLVNFINHPIFPLPSEITKGIIVNVTTFGNILFGPTAIECDKDDTSVDINGINYIKEKVALSVKNANFKKTIKLFAGVRVKSGKDFVVERDTKNNHFYYALGICSPGLTAAPAIAEYFIEMLEQDGIQTKKITAKNRPAYINTQAMDKNSLNELIKKNPAYGRIICRCEEISEGEIIDALNSPLHPYTIDAIKRRVRPTMGRCQGSFCIPKLIKIFAEQRKIKQEQVTIDGKTSELLVSNIKEGGFYEK